MGIRYPWKPLKCQVCNRFGHVDKVCPKKIEVAALVQGVGTVQDGGSGKAPFWCTDSNC